MKNNILVTVATHMKEEGTSTLKALKRTFVDYVNGQLKGFDFNDIFSKTAFEDDELDFANFAFDFVGFAIFHTLVEGKKKKLSEDGPIDAMEIADIFDSCNAAAKATVKTYADSFTKSLFDELALLVDAMGHKTQIIELKTGDNEDEIMSQLKELQSDDE